MGLGEVGDERAWWDRDVANLGSERASEIGDSRISPAIISLSLSQAPKSFSNFPFKLKGHSITTLDPP